MNKTKAKRKPKSGLEMIEKVKRCYKAKAVGQGDRGELCKYQKALIVCHGNKTRGKALSNQQESGIRVYGLRE